MAYFPDCEDSSTYYYKTFWEGRKSGMEGYVIDNLRQGEWRSSDRGWTYLYTYKDDQIIKMILRDSISNRLLSREDVLNDSITRLMYFHRNGRLSAMGSTINGDQFGSWIEFDSTGRYKSKGEYLGEMRWDTIEEVDEDTGEIIYMIVGAVPKTGLWFKTDLKTNSVDTTDFSEVKVSLSNY